MKLKGKKKQANKQTNKPNKNPEDYEETQNTSNLKRTSNLPPVQRWFRVA